MDISLAYWGNRFTVQKEILVHIRWMIRRDMPEVVRIEKRSSGFPWWEEDFICYLRQRNCIGMVAEYENQILGFMVYQLYRTRIDISKLAVHPMWRHLGVGSQMISRLLDKLSLQRRSQITINVRETNLAAQWFLYENGFRAISVLRNFYEDSLEDAYFMRLNMGTIPFSGKNRISQYLECTA